MSALDVKCILVRSDEDRDWWCIERAEHDGREWMHQIERGVMAFTRSARLGPVGDNADIEGTGAEMLDIAAAIETGGAVSFKRCSAETTATGVELMSPRNNIDPVTITAERALELAADIRAKVAETPAP